MDNILRGFSELIDYESSLIVSRIKELGLVEKSRTYPVFAKDFNGWRYYYLTKISIGKTVEDIQQIESIFLIATKHVNRSSNVDTGFKIYIDTKYEDDSISN